MKSVTFILPGQGTKPSGGFKVVYEYANYLVKHGWYVEVIHIAWLNNIASLCKGIAKYFVYFFNYKPSRWFNLHNKVKTRWVLKLKKINTKKVVATAWLTAELLYRLKKADFFDKYYLIQGDESKFDDVVVYNWQERVYVTWKYNWKIIVINNFLFEMIAKYNQNIIKITNGIDCEKYKIMEQIDYRKRFSICMLGHIFECKGTKVGVEAFNLLKIKYPNMQVTIFGVYPKMAYISDWINYEYMASQERIVGIYNQSALFVSCSYTEGFGLPLVEAMACGCAAVVSDIPAYRDIANETMALYFEAGNIKDIVNKIEYFFDNDIKRQEYAYRSSQYIKSSFSFEKSAEALEKYISIFGNLS
jgi:glycosyltransferase involved in cell wall biosynthesis